MSAIINDNNNILPSIGTTAPEPSLSHMMYRFLLEDVQEGVLTPGPASLHRKQKKIDATVDGAVKHFPARDISLDHTTLTQVGSMFNELEVDK